MTIKVANGRITFELTTTDTFVGSTAAGEYPPVGADYKHFDCKPTEKSGVIVFGDLRSIGNRQEPWYTFYQFVTTDDNKIIVTYKLEDWDRPFQQIKGMGLVVEGQKWTYVTTMPVGQEGKYILVDIIDMLKYIEGRITIDQLRRRAKQREEVEIKRELLQTVTLQRDGWKTEVDRLMQRHEWDQQTIEDLRSFRARAIIIGQVVKRGIERQHPWVRRWLTSIFTILGTPDWEIGIELKWLSLLYHPTKPEFKGYPDLTR